MAFGTYDSAEYKDISELKKELEGIKGRRDVSNKELYDAVQKLAQVMGDIVEVFGAAAEQMNLEEKELESSAKNHETIINKLDKIISQNKTIAEGIVTAVEAVKEKAPLSGKDLADELLNQKRNEEPFFKPKQQFSEPTFFMKSPQPQQEDWTKPEQEMPRIDQMPQRPQQQMMPPPMMPPPIMPRINPPQMQPMPSSPMGSMQASDFGMQAPPQMPPMEPSAPSDIDLDFEKEFSLLGEGPKKKGLFGMFKK